MATGLGTPSIIKWFLCVHLYVSICVFVCLLLMLLITSGMIWTPYDSLKKFYIFHMSTIVGIVSRCGHAIEVHYRNQPNRVS